MLAKYLWRFRPKFSTAHLQKLQQLYNNKKYEQILQINNIASPTYSEVKSNYYRLIKKYHSDNCQDDEKKSKIYEEISKIIIRSYHELDKQKFGNTKSSSGFQQASYAEEDEICMELFNKKFSQVKYWMYEQGNEAAKNAFFKKLFQKTGKGSSTSSYTTNSSSYSNTAYTSTSSSSDRSVKNAQNQQSDSSFQMLGVGAAILAGLFILGYYKNKAPAQPPRQPTVTKKYDYSEKAIGEIVNKRIDKVYEKRQKMIASILQDHPPCLHIPFEEEPHLMKQLTEYSIAPDIHLYEIDPKYFEEKNKNQIIKNGFQTSLAFELTRIKPNTVMTLSLEAERALQNTYVKVKDVINQIKQTGKFKPPQIFFRFHGYIMFELRQKPISLANYRDTDYVSLFDLYFDYYSPIWLKKDCFTQYLVGKDEPQYFGWVHLNNRKCDSVYMNTGDKAAFFLPVTFRGGKLATQLWDNYYRTYYRNWLPDR